MRLPFIHVRALMTLKAMGPGMERHKKLWKTSIESQNYGGKSHMKKYLFDLQLFADGDNGQDPGNNDPGQNNTTGGDGDKGENKSQPKYTDEDLDRIIQEKKAKWEKQAKDNEEEAKKLAKMNAQQKAEHERNKLQKQLDELLAEKARADMAREARKMCAEANVNVSDDILASIITSDADTTKEAVESFIELFKGEVEKAVKDALKGNSFKRGGSNGGVTKEDIMKVSDPIERQRLIRENMNLFR